MTTQKHTFKSFNPNGKLNTYFITQVLVYNNKVLRLKYVSTYETNKNTPKCVIELLSDDYTWKKLADNNDMAYQPANCSLQPSDQEKEAQNFFEKAKDYVNMIDCLYQNTKTS